MPIVVRRRPLPASPPPRRRRLLWLGLVLLVFAVVAAFVIRPFWQLTSQFDELTYRQPSRLYARATLLYPGRIYPLEQLVAELRSEGYREDPGPSSLAPVTAGRYRRTASGLDVFVRSFPTSDGKGGGGVLEISYRNDRIARLVREGHRVASAPLEPALLASYYGPDIQERRPVAIGEVSNDLIAAVLAAEDDSFFRHSGVSLTGMARALWVNLSGGEIRQGGSTLTQQLVKNVYLTQERTWGRKVQEVILAVLLDLRYDKRQILEAYLNEIYLGGSGGVSLMGMGAASRAYFGKDPAQVDLAEAATLAGMIRAPGPCSPLYHPEQAKARRDWVLHRLEKLRSVDAARIEQALATPLTVAPEPLTRRRAPYFADAMATEAQRRFGLEDLADGGYALFSTLDWRGQQEAQAAVLWGLQAAEKGYQRGHRGQDGQRGQPLQSALVSVDPEDGGILAYVGGRSYDKSQFDRAGQARRQAGSAFKPIVYAAAFEARKTTPAAFLEDEPLTINLAGRLWSPKNDDGTFHGWVTVRSALEHSYNPATTRLALQVGMPRIVDLARDMGVGAPMSPFPSVALGAVEVTPLEMASVYATLAAGGVRPPVHGLVGVLDRYGKPVDGAPLRKPERVLSPQSSYLVTSLLKGVLERGTGSGAAAELRGDLAGKTGTTNSRRDSWFCGYSPDRATAVWVGYDDNSPTRLSGARAALPIWSRFTTRVTPSGGYATFAQPSGVVTALIDPTTGLLATEYCPRTLTEVFREGEVPNRLCDRHGAWSTQVAGLEGDDGAAIDDEGGAPGDDDEAITQPEERREERRHPFRHWLRKVFGGGDDKDGKDKKDAGDGRKPPGSSPPVPLSHRPPTDRERGNAIRAGLP
jgi:penicillin-binding protein 1B